MIQKKKTLSLVVDSTAERATEVLHSLRVVGGIRSVPEGDDRHLHTEQGTQNCDGYIEV